MTGSAVNEKPITRPGERRIGFLSVFTGESSVNVAGHSKVSQPNAAAAEESRAHGSSRAEFEREFPGTESRLRHQEAEPAGGRGGSSAKAARVVLRDRSRAPGTRGRCIKATLRDRSRGRTVVHERVSHAETSGDQPRFFSSPRVGFVRACRVRAGVRGGVTGSLGAKKTFAFPSQCNKTKGRPR